MSRSKCAIVLAALATVGLSSAAQAATFITVATNSTPMPGYGTDFASFSSFTSGIVTDGLNVVFIGANSNSSNEGVYDYNIASGSLSTVALLNSSAPDGGTFTNLQYPSIGNGVVGFVGTTTNTTNASSGQGIYAATPSGASLRAIADTTTDIPNDSPTTTFGYFYPTAQNGNNLVYSAGAAGAGFNGVYLSTSGGTPSALVDDSMNVSGQSGVSGKYGSFSAVTVGGNIAAFQANEGSASGVFTIPIAGGSQTFIAGSNSAIASGGSSAGASFVPGTSNAYRFETQYGPVTDGNNVLFWGQYNIQNNGATSSSGLYLYPASGGTGTVVMNNSTLIPGQTSDYFNPTYSASSYAVSNGIIAFNGADSNGNQEGIYTYQNGVISPLVVYGTALDGSTVTYAALEGFTGDGIANGVDDYVFYATLEDGVSGVFLDPVTVPEPTSLALLGLGGLLVLRRRPVVANTGAH